MSTRVAVITTSRADFGLLAPLISAIDGSPRLEPLVVATGAHLDPAHGFTIAEIEAEGVPVAARVPVALAGDAELDVAHAVGGLVGAMADAFEQLAPDVVVVLGDRYETFAAASAALLLRIPIAHIHGGELTYGAIDDALRHSITKMSLLHFASSAEYARRIVQMGEDSERVWNVGALGVDNILNEELLPPEEVLGELGLDASREFAVATFHPVTLEDGTGETQIAELLAALDAFPDLQTVFTLPNADAGNLLIREAVVEYAEAHPGRVVARESLGRVRYLSAVKGASLVVGNSSSGVIEAPVLGVPVVNIGDRQAGRIRPGGVVDCEPRREAIVAAIRQARSPEVRAAAAAGTSVFGDGHAAARIVGVLEAFDPSATSMKKHFCDL